MGAAWATCRRANALALAAASSDADPDQLDDRLSGTAPPPHVVWACGDAHVRATTLALLLSNRPDLLFEPPGDSDDAAAAAGTNAHPRRGRSSVAAAAAQQDEAAVNARLMRMLDAHARWIRDEPPDLAADADHPRRALYTRTITAAVDATGAGLPTASDGRVGAHADVKQSADLAPADVAHVWWHVCCTGEWWIRISGWSGPTPTRSARAIPGSAYERVSYCVVSALLHAGLARVLNVHIPGSVWHRANAAGNDKSPVDPALTPLTTAALRFPLLALRLLELPVECGLDVGARNGDGSTTLLQLVRREHAALDLPLIARVCAHPSNAFATPGGGDPRRVRETIVEPPRKHWHRAPRVTHLSLVELVLRQCVIDPLAHGGKSPPGPLAHAVSLIRVLLRTVQPDGTGVELWASEWTRPRSARNDAQAAAVVNVAGADAPNGTAAAVATAALMECVSETPPSQPPLPDPAAAAGRGAVEPVRNGADRLRVVARAVRWLVARNRRALEPHCDPRSFVNFPFADMTVLALKSAEDDARSWHPNDGHYNRPTHDALLMHTVVCDIDACVARVRAYARDLPLAVHAALSSSGEDVCGGGNAGDGVPVVCVRQVIIAYVLQPLS